MNIDHATIMNAVFESTADGLLLVNNNGKVIALNKRFQELWKIPSEILSTQNDDLMISFILDQLLNPQTFIGKVKELYQDSKAISNDIIEFKDGRVFERFSRPLNFEDKSVGRIWSFRDVTEQKKSKEVFGAITTLSPDIISIIDRDGNILFTSKAAERIQGYDSEELLGKNILDLVHADDKVSVMKTLKEHMTTPGAIKSFEYRFRNKSGSYSWIETTSSNQIDNFLIKGIVTISREINERKRMEQELKDALQLREDFISIASHEFKTPLSSIMLQLELLQKAQRKEPAPLKKYENLNNILGQVEYLQKLIDDLLNVSIIKKGQFRIHATRDNLSQFVSDSLKSFELLFVESDCKVELNITPELYANFDRIRLEQVIINLISNTAKYAPGTLVIISLQKKENHIEFSIKDHGPGIPLNKQKQIFESFERASISNGKSGLGLGLYISKNIIEGHHGSLRVDSQPGEGSKFSFDLPLPE